MTGSQVLQRSPSESRRAHDRAAQLLRALAERDATSLPLLSVYLDIRPPADAADPRARAARVLLRDRLRDVKESLASHGPEHDSFVADATRFEDLMEDLVAQPERGFAAFACSGVGLF